MKFVKATLADFNTVKNIVHTTIKEIYPNYYPLGVVEFFLNHHSDENIRKGIETETVLLLDVEGTIVGTGSTHLNEINRMFVLKQFQGLGYGTFIMNELENIISKKYSEIILHSSSPAYNLYIKRGYIPIKYDKITTQNKDVLCFNIMEKSIKRSIGGDKEMGAIALLVVDVQNALVLAEPFAVKEIITNIKRLIKVSRENNVEVIYIQHNDKIGEELEPNSEGWKIYEEVSPNSNEMVINKNYNSAFKETGLKEYLDSKAINQLIITGMQTEYCIDTTYKVAFEYGFKLFIPEKTNTTFNNGNILAKDLYEHYNFNIFNGRFGIVESMESTMERLIR